MDTADTFVSFSSYLYLQERVERKVSVASWDTGTIRRADGKTRVGMALSEGCNAKGNTCAAPGSTKALEAHLKCLYTNTCSMRNKEDELEVLVCSQRSDVIGIIETCWNESHGWSARMEGYRLFRRDRQSRQGVVVNIRARFNSTALMISDDVAERLWVRIREMEDKADIIVVSYYRINHLAKMITLKSYSLSN